MPKNHRSAQSSRFSGYSRRRKARPQTLLSLLLLLRISATVFSAEPLLAPSEDRFTEKDALRMLQSGRDLMAPVYPALAEQIVKDFDLAGRKGIGIDLGGGPGYLAIELSKRTQLHWVNADINPHFFPHFFEAARAADVGYRVSAIFADAQALPFRANYAEIVVSRGSFQFWEDKARAFRDIYRVLKPGGVAFIGRGFSPNLPVEAARRIREAQKKSDSFPKYDVAETERELRRALDKAGLSDYQIRIPKVPGAEDINYGIWLEFRKPLSRKESTSRLSPHFRIESIADRAAQRRSAVQRESTFAALLALWAGERMNFLRPPLSAFFEPARARNCIHLISEVREPTNRKAGYKVQCVAAVRAGRFLPVEAGSAPRKSRHGKLDEGDHGTQLVAPLD